MPLPVVETTCPYHRRRKSPLRQRLGWLPAAPAAIESVAGGAVGGEGLRRRQNTERALNLELGSIGRLLGALLRAGGCH
jgi:hypothetical protein